MKLKLIEARIAFPALFEPKAVVGSADGKLKFSGVFIIDPKGPNAKLLRESIPAVAKQKWGAKADAILAELKAKDRICYREFGLSKEGKVYEGFEGMHYINTSSDARPLVLDRNRGVLSAQDGKPYGGCYVHASVEIYAQDNKWGKRINGVLKAVQFVRDGDAFGGGAPVSVEEFEDLGVDEEAIA